MEEHGENYYNVTCPICGKKFHLKPYRLKRSKINYCSKECFRKAKMEYMKGEGNHQYGLKGSKNASWKSDKRISNYGYRMVRCPDHPFKGYDGFVFEHRLVAEQNLLTEKNSVEINGKRYLSPDYIVHHKNGNRLDNRVENLEVMTLAEHSSMHNKNNPQPRDPLTHRFVSRRFKVKVKIDKGGFLPSRAHYTDAGYDIKTPVAFDVPAHGNALIGTKVHMNIPAGYAGFIKSKSGLNTKHGLLCEGVVDAQYMGEIWCKFYNHSDIDYHFKAGDKMTQLVIVPVLSPTLEVVQELGETERGDNGFGSTGR